MGFVTWRQRGIECNRLPAGNAGKGAFLGGVGGRPGETAFKAAKALMLESLLKLIVAIAAIMAISMLVYTCSPMAPLERGPAPLETLQQSSPVPPQADGN